jgi:hypothetical protein
MRALYPGHCRVAGRDVIVLDGWWVTGTCAISREREMNDTWNLAYREHCAWQLDEVGERRYGLFAHVMFGRHVGVAF